MQLTSFLWIVSVRFRFISVRFRFISVRFRFISVRWWSIRHFVFGLNVWRRETRREKICSNMLHILYCVYKYIYITSHQLKSMQEYAWDRSLG